MRRIGILYFSAVGATKLASELLAELLGQKADGGEGRDALAVEIASIEDERAGPLVAEAEFLVFCYPTYYLKPAPPMRDFAAGLGPFDPPKPCYILTSCELYSENSARRLAKILAGRGLRTRGWKALRAPGSDVTAVIGAGLVPWLYRFGPDFERRLRAAADGIADAASEDGLPPTRLPPPRWYTPLTQLLQIAALDHFDAVKHRLRVFGERCTRCGFCAASCPAGAIAMGAEGPLFDTPRCMLCCRCIHACPERAIALSERLKDNRRIDPELLAGLKAQARDALGLGSASAFTTGPVAAGIRRDGRAAASGGQKRRQRKEHAMANTKTFEEALEDNPLRPLVRDRMEIAPLARAAGAGRIESALQVACARGDSTAQLLRRFDVGELVAVDKSQAMISLAGTRHPGLRADFRVMDIPRLDFPAGRFDAVFNLAELHNYANWREGLSEMARVLKAGGLLIMNELSIESFTRGMGPYFMRRTVHPYARMFSAGELRAALHDNGLDALHFRTKSPLGLLPYLIVVARKR